jgi:hypothetical protein
LKSVCIAVYRTMLKIPTMYAVGLSSQGSPGIVLIGEDDK